MILCIIKNKDNYLCRDYKKIQTEGKNERKKYNNSQREKVIKMYLKNNIKYKRSIERLEGISEPLILY